MPRWSPTVKLPASRRFGNNEGKMPGSRKTTLPTSRAQVRGTHAHSIFSGRKDSDSHIWRLAWRPEALSCHAVPQVCHLGTAFRARRTYKKRAPSNGVRSTRSRHHHGLFNQHFPALPPPAGLPLRPSVPCGHPQGGGARLQDLPHLQGEPAGRRHVPTGGQPGQGPGLSMFIRSDD